MQCAADKMWWVFFPWRLAALLARSCQKIKVFKLKVYGVRVGKSPFRTIETALFEGKLSQDTLSSGETIGAGNQIFTINLNNFVN